MMTRLEFPAHHRPPQALAELVAGWHGVSVEDLASGDAAPPVAKARQDLVLILTEFTALDLTMIGTALNRPPTVIAYLLRSARSEAHLHEVARLRMTSLRSAALALPVEMAAPEAASAHDIARRAVGSGAAGAFDRLALACIAAAQVLRDPKLSAEDARHAALCLLTRPASAPAFPVQVA